MTKDQEKNVRLWVDALRSGEYEQGKGTLKTTDGRYCCLGVACKVYLENRPPKAPKEIVEDHLETEGYLPVPVARWLGLTTNSGGYDAQVDGGDGLAIWNDAREKSFKWIAALIERKPKGMFVE